MSNYPDFSCQGYQVIRELGNNHAGGRVTYLAASNETQVPVVIKQFQFAQSRASWAGYDTCEREIQLLQQLRSPSIPRYLDSFETTTGFCLVQEYKKAPTLAVPRHFTPQEIKQIAIAVLEILVYLQQQQPPVIHRDIKPENILVDRSGQLKVYLVDFGFAHFGNSDVAVSSMVKGTLGFMPPEQLFNRQLTEASDLYSLGVTLICLLTKTKSTEINNLIDEAYRIKFKSRLPKLNPQFVEWLSKMVNPQLKHRFPNAAIALKALNSIDVASSQNQLGATVRWSLVASIILLLVWGGTHLYRLLKSPPSPLVAIPTRHSFHAGTFYISSFDKPYVNSFPVDGVFEGEYRIYPKYIEVIIKKGTIYNSRGSKQLLTSIGVAVGNNGQEKKNKLLRVNKMMTQGDKYIFTDIRCLIPKNMHTNISNYWMYFDIEFDNRGHSYVNSGYGVFSNR